MLPFLFQPLRLDIKRKLTARSDRVKSCDLHPTENWMLASLYNGNVHIWNIETQTLVKSFEVCDLPVRCARFVARKSWVVVGSDDMQVSFTIINVYCLVTIIYTPVSDVSYSIFTKTNLFTFYRCASSITIRWSVSRRLKLIQTTFVRLPSIPPNHSF